MSDFIKETIDGAAAAVINEFGSGYKVYTDFVEQGLEGPCFFIGCIGSSETEQLDEGYRRRFLRRHDVEVVMFPQKGAHERAELYNEAAEKLYDALELIEIGGDKVRGKERRHEVSDGLLIFYASFEFPILRISDDRPIMRELEMM